MNNSEQQLTTTNQNGEFLAKLKKMEIGKTSSSDDLLPGEAEAGGAVELQGMSKVFRFRLTLGSGDTAVFAIKDQTLDEKADPVWMGNIKDPIRAIILEGVNVFKLFQYMVKPPVDPENMTNDEQKVLAISYGLKSETRGSFDPDFSQWLDNKRMFDKIRMEGRVQFFAIFPDIKELNYEPVFCSFGVTGVTAYNNLLKMRSQLPKYPCLPYFYVKMHHEPAVSQRTGKSYRRLTLAFDTSESLKKDPANKHGFIQVADIDVLRNGVVIGIDKEGKEVRSPSVYQWMKAIQYLIKITREQTESGSNIDYEKEVAGTTELLDEHGNPIEF